MLLGKVFEKLYGFPARSDKEWRALFGTAIMLLVIAFGVGIATYDTLGGRAVRSAASAVFNYPFDAMGLKHVPPCMKSHKERRWHHWHFTVSGPGSFHWYPSGWSVDDVCDERQGERVALLRTPDGALYEDTPAARAYFKDRGTPVTAAWDYRRVRVHE